MIMADELVRVIAADQARVNITWAGQNGELPDPVYIDATDANIRRWVTEAVRNGSIPGIPEDPTADFADFIIDRFEATEARPYALLQIRPKTAYGFADGRASHECHWHFYSGTLMMEVPAGHVVQQCCKCDATRVVHRAHARN